MIEEANLESLEAFVLNNPELDILEDLLSQFNVFETLNMVNAETRHSNTLAWLFNPKGNHGLGEYFAKRLLKHFASMNKSMVGPKVLFELEIMDYSDMEVRREWKGIDILLVLSHDDRKYVVAIENKIRTLEHSNQLQRYRESVNQEFGEHTKLFIYLTPEEVIPSDQNWVPFSYATIADILDDLINAKRDALGQNVLNFIEQYNVVLRRYIVGESEISRICSQIYRKHKDALELIFQYKPDIMFEVSEYLQTQLKQHSHIVFDSAAKTTIKFTTKTLDDLIRRESEGWTKSKRILLYEFSNYDNRLILRLYIGPGTSSYRQKLVQFHNRYADVFATAAKTAGKKWQTIYQKEFLNKKHYEDASIQKLAPVIDRNLEDFVKGDMVKIDKCFQENWRTD